MKFLFSFLFFSTLCCTAQDNVLPNSSMKHKSFYRQLAKHFHRIDSLQQHGGYDSLDFENQEVLELIKQYKEEIFQFPDSLDYDLIYLTKSNDKKLALISWDTREGGTMIDFRSLSVFKTSLGIETKLLIDTSDNESSDSYLHYNSIASITTSAGNKIYLAWGNGQGSTALPWQELRAFAIQNSQLVEPPIFPGRKCRLFVEFDLHAFKDDQEVPSIRIKQHGNLIEVPESCKNEGFCGKYKTYQFNGETFEVKRSTIKKIPCCRIN